MAEAVVQKQTDRDNAYYTVYWSGLRKSKKYDIISSVPSQAGLYELYYRDRKKKLNLFFIARAWYGGLRNAIRKSTDPELVENANHREILEKYDCYYRYAITDSYNDLADVYYFFALTYLPEKAKDIEPSGRYASVHLEEVDREKIVTI